MSQAHGIVIGGGPAGSIAAILLARAGWNVRLIEQHRFPRDKVCGECLSALGIEVLRRSGLAHAVERLRPMVLGRTILHATDGKRVELSLPRAMWGISRAAFDGALLAAAHEAGVEILQPARAEQLIAGARPIVRVRCLPSNRMENLGASIVLVADGKGALLGQKPAPTGELGVKAHFGGVDAPADAIGLFGVDHHYCGVAPIERGRWNVAFSVPATRVAEFGGNFDRLFSAMCDENLALRQQFHRAGRVRDWVAAPLPRFAVQDDWPDHVIPLGNAAAALEPIGGEGIGLALRSAELAAGALIDANRRGTRIDTRSLRRQFNRLWRTRRFACRAAGFVMSSPNLAAAAAPIIDDSLPLKTMALALMGKA